MMIRSIVCAAALCAAAAAVNDRVSAREGHSPIQHVTLDAVLNAYLGGDTEVVARTFARSPDFGERLRFDDPRELERWLGSWNRGKALLLIEIARASARVAPQYTFLVVRQGRRYLGTAFGGDPAPSDAAAFVQLWQRAAAGLLQGVSEPIRVEEHVSDLASQAGKQSPVRSLDARLVLARAVARERTCWSRRPSLDQPAVRVVALTKAAGVTVPVDRAGPTKAGRETEVKEHNACLREAVTLFEAAAGMEETRAEARVRGGWILFQAGRITEARDWLGGVEPRDDRDLTYWLGLFRGRVFDALDKAKDAETAYRSAFAVYPGAQSAGIGLALALMRLDRETEADEIASAVRAAGPAAPDPWAYYLDGDQRFVDRWIDQLRQVVR